MTATPEKLTAGELNQFTGTEHWYRHTLNPKITYTDGVQFLAERAGAYWLLDEIACANLGLLRTGKALNGQSFQVWKLQLDDSGDGAALSVEDSNGNVLHAKRIEFTDFPLRQIEIWCVAGGPGPRDTQVIMLPSEY
jgi:hypothetical protein